MKIFWVEDFGEQPGVTPERVSMTRKYMAPVLDKNWKEGSGRDEWEHHANTDAMAFMRALADNTTPIIWADGLASGMAALELGVQAFQTSKYDDPLPELAFPYDVAILDLDIPTGENDGLLDEYLRTAAANALVKPFYAERSEFFHQEFLDNRPNCAGVILALKLMQKGMPAERIFFLTGHGDALNSSAKALLGGMLPKQCLTKTTEDIEKLRNMIQGNSYYIARELVLNSISTFRNESSCSELQIFPFTDESEGFRLNDKEAVFALLDELQSLFSSYFPGKEEEVLRYRIGIELIAKHFDVLGEGAKNSGKTYNPLFTFYVNTHENNSDRDRTYEHPARHAAKFLKNIRNIHAHCTYFHKVNELEFGIIFIIFINFIRSLYGLKESPFLSYIIQFLNAEFPSGHIFRKDWAEHTFMQRVADEYQKNRQPDCPFWLAMANFPPPAASYRLGCCPDELLGATFLFSFSRTDEGLI